jgi:hypothetical protein
VAPSAKTAPPPLDYDRTSCALSALSTGQTGANLQKRRHLQPGNQALLRQGAELSAYPHHSAIARAFGLPDFKAPATIDPSVRSLGSEAATENGRVRFAGPPSLEVAAHEAAHVVQGRHGQRRASSEDADRHAVAAAQRVTRGLGAADLMRPGALIASDAPGPQSFVPVGAAVPAEYTVAAGDTLKSIALDIYGDEKYSTAIRVANPGVVKVDKAGVATVSTGDVLTLPERPDATDPWVNPYVSKLLRDGGSWSEAEAEATLKAFAAQISTVRDKMVAYYLPFGNIPMMLSSLPANSTQAGGTYETQARDLLQRIQRTGARAEAKAQGLANENAMAQAQATEMIARNKAAASAALGGATPTTAQVAAQQATQAAQQSIPAQTATMSAAQETAFNNTLNNTSIPDFVKWVTANHPTLGLTAAHLRADARAIFDRGQNIIAFADGTNLRAVVGEEFIKMVAADPAYALGTVVHEVWGHNTYEGQGKYGTRGAAYGLDIYDKAAAKMPGYTRPTGAGRTSEIDNYGYQETEMYSLMREIEYYTPNAPAHSAITSNYDPEPAIQDRIQMISDGLEAKVARSLLRGLYLRFLADPTVSAKAMHAFRRGVNAVFSATDATAILA